MRTVLLLLVLFSSAHANNLKDVYELAEVQDTRLRAAQFQRDALVEAHAQAVSQWLPQVVADRAIGYEAIRSQGTGEEPGCTSNAVTGKEKCSGIVSVWNVNLAQTLWSFQAFSLLKEANQQRAAAEAEYESARQNLILRVARAYFAVLSAGDQQRTSRNKREAFMTLLSQARSREETGVGPRRDVLQVEAEYDTTEQELIDSQNAFDDANLALERLVGRRIEPIAPLREEIPVELPLPNSPEEWVLASRTDNLEVRVAELSMNSAAQDVAVQLGKALPVVSLTAGTSKEDENQGLGGNQTLGAVGVTAVGPLFQGGAILSLVRQARAVSHAAEANYQAALRDAERSTRAAFRGMVTGTEEIDATRRALESRRRAVTTVRSTVELGVGTESSLIRHEEAYFTAQSAYNRARYRYLINLLTLKQLAGRLTQQDLNMVDGLLTERASE
jgi:outer membrane protein